MRFLIIITVTILFKLNSASFCHWNSGCPYKYFSSATSYNSIRGDIRDQRLKLKGCEPVSVWGLFRHGKRYPSIQYGKKMKDALAIKNNVVSSYLQGRSSLCAQDIEDLQNWPIDKKMFDKAHHLTDDGYEEMFGIGKRFKEAFPGILQKLQPGDYTFRPAYGHWIEDSMKAFINGLNDRNIRGEKALTDSDIMAPYATCGKYQNEVQKNPSVYAEADKYASTAEYLAAIDRIQRRTGVDIALSVTNITALYDLCRHTWSGVETKLSPWCALFTKDDLQVFEYQYDIKSYYKNGYGTPQNELFGHIPLVDLLKSFQNAKEGNGKKISGYFTHSTMLNMVYTALDLFKDSKPLTSSNRDRDRKWRSSVISAFSVNIVAVLNRCSETGPNDYNVVFYLNEEPIRSICAEGVCTWKEFEEKLTPFVNTSIDFCEFKSELY